MSTEAARRDVSALSEGLGPTPTLVERLRTRPTGDPSLNMMAHEAADEIVRLRAFAQDVADHAFEQHQDYWAAKASEVLGPNDRAEPDPKARGNT